MRADMRVSAVPLACECSLATIALLPVTPGLPPTATRNSSHLPTTAATTSPLTMDEGEKTERRKEG